MNGPGDGRGRPRRQGPWFWSAAAVVPLACLAGGIAVLLSGLDGASAILAGCLFFAAVASLAYFASRRRRHRGPGPRFPR